MTESEKIVTNRVEGVVSNCHSLRLREGANLRSKELAVIPVDTRVSVNLYNSTESFYEVTYRNNRHDLVGFCLKDFISIE